MSERQPRIITDIDELIEAIQNPNEESEIWALPPDEVPIEAAENAGKKTPLPYLEEDDDHSLEEQIKSTDSDVVSTVIDEGDEPFSPYVDFIKKGKTNPNLEQGRINFKTAGEIFSRIIPHRVTNSLPTGD